MSTADRLAGRPLERLAVESFRRALGAEPPLAARAPGRVNLIGEHTDYNAGFVLPAAIDREIQIAARPRDDGRVRVFAAQYDETVELSTTDLAPGRHTGWSALVAGVLWALREGGYVVRGFDGAAVGNLPVGAGLGSSAALAVAAAVILRTISEIEISEADLARLCQRAENDYVGVRCGIMDPLTSACARADHALFIDCRNLEYRPVQLPPAVRIVILDTGVKRELAASEYNRRREECEEALALIREHDPDIEALRDVLPEEVPGYEDRLPAILAKRVRHVVGEIERVKLAVAAFEHNETERVGELMLASHRSLRDDYEVSSPELDALVDFARGAPGIIGARMTGAGFGGCTVNLVAAAWVDEFVERVGTRYAEKFGARPEAYVTQAVAGASLEKIGNRR